MKLKLVQAMQDGGKGCGRVLLLQLFILANNTRDDFIERILFFFKFNSLKVCKTEVKLNIMWHVTYAKVLQF